MSINKLISIQHPITNALDMAALDHNAHLPLFTVWATEAEKEIGGANTVPLIDVLDIHCGAAHLPCNAVSLDGAILGDHGCDCHALFNKCWSNRNVIDVTPMTHFLVIDTAGAHEGHYNNIVPYGIQDNKIIFDSCVSIEKLTIRYQGYKIDCNGFMEISENHVKAIMHYILYCWLMRKRKKSNVELQEMKWHYTEWDRECANARALDRKQTATEKEHTVDMVNDPFAGRSLSIGMHTTIRYGGIGY